MDQFLALFEVSNDCVCLAKSDFKCPGVRKRRVVTNLMTVVVEIIFSDHSQTCVKWITLRGLCKWYLMSQDDLQQFMSLHACELYC